MSKPQQYQPYSDTVPITSYNPHNEHVNVVMNGEEAPFRWSWSNMICTMLSMLCCCCPVGLVAVFFSGKAFVSHGLTQFKKSRREMQLAQKLGLAALIIGIVCITVYIVLEVIVITMVVKNIKEAQNSDSNAP